MTGTILFDPLLPWPLVAALAALAALGVVLALWRGLSGWALRALAGLVLVGAVMQQGGQRRGDLFHLLAAGMSHVAHQERHRH